jgi:ribose 5-phosphate isomerase B
MRIALATDHAGFEVLHELKNYLSEKGHECQDYGPESLDPNDDYPQFMFRAAHAVADGQADYAIILGGSGQGEAMAANRVKGVRCAVFYGSEPPKAPVDQEGHNSDDPHEILKLSRSHNNANALSLAARFLSLDQVKQAVDVWLNTPFSNIERHARRVNQLDEDDA